MSTAEPPRPDAPAAVAAPDSVPDAIPEGAHRIGDEQARAMASELERLANAFFMAHPSPSSLPFPQPAAAPPHELPGAVAPPRFGSSAMSPGAGGLAAAGSSAPLPGAVQQPPLANAPIPKESELRNLPATLADIGGSRGYDWTPPTGPPEASGVPSLPEFPSLDWRGPARESSTPYFLESSARAPAAAEPVQSSDKSPEPQAVPAARGLFDAGAVKRDFPILRQRVHGRPLVWLDNAATTQKPQAVIDRLSYFYERENSNIHRAAHALAARATDAYEAARDKVRGFLNAPSVREIVFVRGTTEGINLVAQSWGRQNVGPDDEIVITWLEHHANIVPWQRLCAEKGARLRVAPVDDRGQIILEEYERLLGPRTRLVSLSQVSNALGTITPAREMIESAHRHGARVLVDGAQAVSHMPVDVQLLDCDFYVFSGHKVFAPTGIGAVYGKPEVLSAMPPWQGGGNMIQDVTFEKTTYQPAPARFEAGTGNIADAVGLGAAIDYVTALGLPNISRHEHELLTYATSELARVPGLDIIGTAADKAGVVSFVIDGVPTENLGRALDQEGIAVRAGHHCAQPILRRFGLESTVRASFAPYNTCEDVDALVTALLRLARP